MSVQRFFSFIGNKVKAITATVISTGSAEGGNIVALDTDGKLHTSVLPIGIGADTKVLPASENLSAGDFVNVWNDSGTVKVRKADASSNAKEAHGFVLSSVSTGNNASVYFEGTNNQLSGLTLGATYFLSTTAGSTATTVPTTTGHIVQQIGVALSTTELSFEPQLTIELG